MIIQFLEIIKLWLSNTLADTAVFLYLCVKFHKCVIVAF